MKHRPLYSVLLAIVLMSLSVTVTAQEKGTLDVPRIISYQGLLTDPDGTAVPDGNYDITVVLYGDASGKQRIWQDTYTVPVYNGIFNIYLGSGATGLPEPAEMSRPLWIGTTINGTDEFSPLTPLSSSPYALNLQDNSVTTGKLADGSVTAEKVEFDYVAAIRINGQEIGGKGFVLDIAADDGLDIEFDDVTQTLYVKQDATSSNIDPDKAGPTTLAGTAKDTAWSLSGDGWDITNGASVLPTNNDWIGTSTNVNFSIAVNNNGAASGGNQRVMQYLPRSTSPNILGGHNSNIIVNGDGNIIAGGGQNSNPNRIDDGTSYGVISGGDTNVLSTDANHSVISGGHKNLIKDRSRRAVISGGALSIIEAESDNSVIAGGDENIVDGPYSTISGGESNIIRVAASDANRTEHGVIGGGKSNLIDTMSSFSTIGGGVDNSILDSAKMSTIAGGWFNVAAGELSTIGGGDHHLASGANSTIAGGVHNKATGVSSFIGGGGPIEHNTLLGQYSNVASGSYAVVTGGYYDTASGEYAFVGSGDRNHAAGDWSVISGGDTNLIRASGDNGFIGGGKQNEIITSGGSIAGGMDNLLDTASGWSFIGSGEINSIKNATHGVIVGGHENRIQGSSGGDANQSYIGGGDSNLITSQIAVINGGFGNIVTGYNGTIGGGRRHVLAGNGGVIGGGFKDTIESNVLTGAIGGGANNKIRDTAHHAVISGGSGNLIDTGAFGGANRWRLRECNSRGTPID